MTIFIIIL